MEGNIRGCRKHVRAIDLSVWPTLLACLTPTRAPSVRGAGCIRGSRLERRKERSATCLCKRIRADEMERERSRERKAKVKGGKKRGRKGTEK